MYITFDDILLQPQFSNVGSRKDIDLSTYITPRRKLDIPLVAANMDSVCESEMAIALGMAGGLGVVHRYMSFTEQLKQVDIVRQAFNSATSYIPIAAAVGTKNGGVDHIMNLWEHGVDIIVIDIAHGHHHQVANLLKAINLRMLSKRDGQPIEIIAGNVATAEGAQFLYEAGADAVKVGVGNGSHCSTRQVTGHGIPQASALAMVQQIAWKMGRTFIADGGVNTSGDIVKALALGASAVMSGSLFAGTDEAPGEVFYNDRNEAVKIYRGMASADAQYEFYGNYPDAPEGVTTTVSAKGSVNGVLTYLIGGIRSGLSYTGVLNLTELQSEAEFIRISTAGYLESQATK